MAPKRKQSAAAPIPSAKAAPKRRSKLAKECNVTADDEVEIQEVWAMFREEVEGFDEKEGAIRTSSVRRCLIALNAGPNDAAELKELIETVDPEKNGYVTYEHFFAIAALKMNARQDDPDAMSDEVSKAYSLFTNGEEREITIVDLKRIAGLLKEDLSDSVLRDMVREATSGRLGPVKLEEFHSVMKRAGVFG